MLTRRTLAKTAAWATPAIALSLPVPAMAASPTSCKTTTMSWGTARAPKISNPTVITVTGGSQTIYAKVTYTQTADSSGTPATYHLGVGKQAWSNNPNIGVFNIATTGGGNDLILNQWANSTGLTTNVTVAFYTDAALTIPATVYGLTVPLDDFSSATTYSGVFTPTLVPSQSYEEAWTVTGTTATGSVTPTLSAITNPYNTTSTLANISGSGTTASPWYFSAQNLTTSSRNSVGGDVITKFGATTGVTSVTVTYGSNPTAWAKSQPLTGSQGAGLGQFTLCV